MKTLMKILNKEKDKDKKEFSILGFVVGGVAIVAILFFAIGFDTIAEFLTKAFNAMDKFFSSLPTWLTPGLAATLLLGVVFPLVLLAICLRTPPNQGELGPNEDNSYENDDLYPDPEAWRVKRSHMTVDQSQTQDDRDPGSTRSP